MQGRSDVFISANSRPPSSVAGEIGRVSDRRRFLSAQMGALMAERRRLPAADGRRETDAPHPQSTTESSPRIAAVHIGLGLRLTS